MRVVPVVSREGWLTSRLRACGLEPQIVDSRGSLSVSYARALLRIAKKENVKLIHAHLLGSSVYTSLVAALLRIPVVAVFHGPTDIEHPGRFANLKWWLLRTACSRIVAVSESTRDALQVAGIQRERITLIRNGIDTTVFFPERATSLRNELQLRSADMLVAAVGNIRAPKAYDTLLRAARLVIDKLPYAHFALIGEARGPSFESLRDMRDALGLQSRFHFTGFRTVTRTLLGSIDVFVSSSRSEGLPLSFLEAMACGVCVVATESGGPQEVVTSGHSGLLVPIEEPVALARAIVAVLEDRELRERLGSEGQEKVRREFGIESTVAQYRALYRDLAPKLGEQS